MELEKRLYAQMEKELKGKARSHRVNPDRVLRIQAAIIDYDLWAFSAILESGLEGFLAKLSERAEEETGILVELFFRLVYAAMCIYLVLLEDAPHHRDTLKALVRLGSSYAEEVEDYLDTLSLLVNDESYRALTSFTEKAEER